MEDETRVRLLLGLATMAYRQGDHPAAIAASDDAADLTMRLGGVADRFQDLKLRAGRALETGKLDEAEVLYREAFGAAVEVDNGVGMSSCRLNLATIANQTGRHEGADSLLQENLPFVRGRGQSRCEAFTLMALAETAVFRKLPEPAAEWATSGARRALGFGEESLAAYCLDVAAAALAEEGRARSGSHDPRRDGARTGAPRDGARRRREGDERTRAGRDTAGAGRRRIGARLVAEEADFDLAQALEASLLRTARASAAPRRRVRPRPRSPRHRWAAVRCRAS